MSRVLLDNGVSIEDSRSTILRGQFSMMLILAVPDDVEVHEIDYLDGILFLHRVDSLSNVFPASAAGVAAGAGKAAASRPLPGPAEHRCGSPA